MQESLWFLKLLVSLFAIFGGCYGVYSIYKDRKEKKIDVARINKLVQEDMLPLSMKDKKIRPDEYLLVCLNELTKVLERSMNNLRSTIEKSTP